MGDLFRFGQWTGYGAKTAFLNLAAAIVLNAAPALADEVTIAALGDSLTQGYGLAPEAGFTRQLEAWLDARGADVTVINAGVSGDTTAGGLARAAWTLTPDVDALIVALGGNDMLRGIDPAAARANLVGILQAAAGQDVPVLLAGMRAPGNFGPDYKAAFDGIYPDLAAEYDTVFYQSFLGPITDQPDRAAALSAYMQADGIHPNAGGVALVVEGIGPSVLELIERAAPES
ncbi:MAG: arylesterase [Alphaproteobacteria bacterium]|nr:arylesterase [Alphaproteobacteria bacterium]NNF23730.1 arylesterase [Paracoccaceae bacterium]